jgi:alcohol dehydrogenase class IV
VLTALEAARLIANAFAGSEVGDEQRDALALGALLAGYAISSAGYGLHHVMSQTLARFAGVGHGAANTIMLPESARALRGRAPAGWFDQLEQALGARPEDFAARLRERSRVTSLREAGVTEEQLERCVEEASQRPELHMTPPVATTEEIRELYTAAY